MDLKQTADTLFCTMYYLSLISTSTLLCALCHAAYVSLALIFND
jgi:hypothetical protein